MAEIIHLPPPKPTPEQFAREFDEAWADGTEESMEKVYTLVRQTMIGGK